VTDGNSDTHSAEKPTMDEPQEEYIQQQSVPSVPKQPEEHRTNKDAKSATRKKEES
jgi:hypothetical protein